jgi:hypothetical protein
LIYKFGFTDTTTGVDILIEEDNQAKLVGRVDRDRVVTLVIGDILKALHHNFEVAFHTIVVVLGDSTVVVEAKHTSFEVAFGAGPYP